MGIDLQASGELVPGWQISAGYNFNREFYSAAFMQQLDAGKSGTAALYLTQQPIHQLKLWSSYRLPGNYKQWSVGGGIRMESARYTQGSVCSLKSDPTGYCFGGTYIPFNFTQGLYAVLDLRAGYRFDDHWNVDFNVTNLTDTRYYATAGDSSSGNFYGEPRAFMLSVHALY
jgi:outer membrane receptor for ferric coprogen and ferric-rhodotorulic acid